MPVMVSIDASDVQRVGLRLRLAGQLVGPALQKALNEAASTHLKALQAAAPVGKKPDPRYPTRLRDSFFIAATGESRQIMTNSPKYKWVTVGTQPTSEFIYPRFKKALYWAGIAGGRPVARVHTHPTAANDFVERASAKAEQQSKPVIQRLADTVALAISGLAKRLGGMFQ